MQKNGMDKGLGLRVLVTGGAGFIGSHLVDLLIETGHTVAVVDNLTYGLSDNVNSAAPLHKFNVCDKSRLRALLDDFQPAAVFHLAAQNSVAVSTKDPVSDAGINILGTVNLLEECRRLPTIPRFIFSSSSAVYGRSKELPCHEDCRLQPEAPYGVSKLSAEHYVAMMGRTYGMPYVILCYGNVYGPRQLAVGESGVCSQFCQRLLSGKPVTVFGDGLHTRDYVYVKDVAKANLAALYGGTGDCVNVGTETETATLDLLKAIEFAVDRQADVTFASERTGETRRMKLSKLKAKSVLGWEPERSLEDGLKELAHFHLAQV